MEKKKIYAIAAVVVVIIVLVIGLGVGLTRKKEDAVPVVPIVKKYKTVPDMNYAFGSLPDTDDPSGVFKFIGRFATVEEVIAKVAQLGYNHFTWHPPALFPGSYAGTAYGLNSVITKTPQGNVVSGDVIV